MQVLKLCLPILATSLLHLSGYEEWFICLSKPKWNLCIMQLLSCLQLAFVGVIYPCLVLQYMGQAAFLSKNMPAVYNSFYLSIPSKLQNTKHFCDLFFHMLPKNSVELCSSCLQVLCFGLYLS